MACFINKPWPILWSITFRPSRDKDGTRIAKSVQKWLDQAVRLPVDFEFNAGKFISAKKQMVMSFYQCVHNNNLLGIKCDQL